MEVTEYYWEYWEGDKFHKGTMEAQNEHMAYQMIRDMLFNDVATVQADEMVGSWAFTELTNDIDVAGQSRYFTESDLEAVRERVSNDSSFEIERDEEFRVTQNNV